MTGRRFIWTAAAGSIRPGTEAPLVIPVHRVMDTPRSALPNSFITSGRIFGPKQSGRSAAEGSNLQSLTDRARFAVLPVMGRSSEDCTPG